MSPTQIGIITNVAFFLLLVMLAIRLHQTEKHLGQAHDAITELGLHFVNELETNMRLEEHHEMHIEQRAKDLEEITKLKLQISGLRTVAESFGIDDDTTDSTEPAVIGEQLAAQLKRDIAAEEERTVKDIFALADAVNENMD